MAEESKKIPNDIAPREVVVHDKSPLSSSFIETFIYEPVGDQEKRFGILVAVVQVYSGKKKKDNASFATNIAETIRDEYYRNVNREPIRSFKIALKKVEAVLEERKMWQAGSVKVNLIIAAITTPRFFLAQLGDGFVCLIRNNSLHPIEVRSKDISTKPARNHLFKEATEGLLKNDDTLILATKEIYKVSPKILQSLVRSRTLEKFIYSHETEFTNLALVLMGNYLTLGKKSIVPKKPEIQKLPQKRFKKKFSSLFAVSGGRMLKVGLVALVAVVLTVVALVTQSRNETVEKRSREIISQSQILEQRIGDLIELENYREAEAALEEWRGIIEELASLDILQGQTENIIEEFEKLEIVVKRIEPVSVRVLLDLSDNSVGFTPKGFEGNNETLYLFSDDVLYTQSLTSAEGGFTTLPSFGGKDDFSIKNLISLSENPRQALILGEGIILNYTNEFSPVFAHPDLEKARAVNFYVDLIYILGEDTIWKFDPNNLSFDKWNKGTFFLQAKDFAIDGFIYVLEKDKIHKLLNGGQNSEIDIEPGIEKIYTSASVEKIYLLNPDRGYVVVANKLGGIERRLQNNEVEGAIDFIVDEEEKTLWFLKDQRVFSISIPTT